MPVKFMLAVAGTCLGLHATAALAQQQRNVVLFVPDGLRALSVTPQSAPTMAAIRDQGVNFANPHSLFPTFTMPNASGMATGHHLGDTGTFSNTIYSGFATKLSADGKKTSVTPFLESDAVLGDVDTHHDGNYINEESLLKAARAHGYSTAAIGKVGPVRLFDHVDGASGQTIIVDDQTGSPDGVPLPKDLQSLFWAKAPGRGANGEVGSAIKPGTKVANIDQQRYFADAATKVVLPLFKQRGKPFVLVFWSRDPDGTQHNQGDSLGKLVPGINGATSLAAIRNADNNLAQIRKALADLGLADSTDIIVSADHGFSTIAKQSATSHAAQQSYDKVAPGQLPAGFLAIDLAHALGLPLFDPDHDPAKPLAAHTFPIRGNGVIGADATHPDIVVASNGGSDLVYLPTKDRALAARVVETLLTQDYVSGLFVDDGFGKIPGTLPLSAISLHGAARTMTPSIVVNFRSFTTGCDQPVMCSATIADTTLQQGQGMHGSFSRADTMNFMAAMGPDFKQGYVDDAPVSNADIGRTLLHVLGLKVADKGKLIGRVIVEALPNGKPAEVAAKTIHSAPSPSGLATILLTQSVDHTQYFDAAGFIGRTVGLKEKKAASR